MLRHIYNKSPKHSTYNVYAMLYQHTNHGTKSTQTVSFHTSDILNFGGCTCGKVNTRNLCYSMISEDTFLQIAYVKLLGFVLKQSNTNALKPNNTKYFVFASWGLWECPCVKSKGLLLISVTQVIQRLAWKMKWTSVKYISTKLLFKGNLLCPSLDESGNVIPT